MKQTLIKLSDTHYIVVDDSEIKEDWVVDTNDANFIFKITSEYIKDNKHYNWKEYKFKITHSTQPLEILPCKCQYGSIMTSSHPCKKECQHQRKGFNTIKPLSLPEVEEAIYGYSVEKMAIEESNKIIIDRNGNPDKTLVSHYIRGFKAHQELVKHLLPNKTEWNVNIDKNGKIIVI